MTDKDHPRFANLRNGGNMPRAKPGRIRNAIGLACIIVISLVFYVVMP